MNLLKDVDWDEVKETAKFYYSDSTTTLNLYPALAITFLVIVCKNLKIERKISLDYLSLSQCWSPCWDLSPPSTSSPPPATPHTGRRTPVATEHRSQATGLRLLPTERRPGHPGARAGSTDL